MLRAIPKNLFAQKYEIFKGDERVAAVDLAWLREAGTVEIAGTHYTIGRTGLISGSFFLKKYEDTIVSAVKSSAFSRSFVIGIGGNSYTLGAASVFSRRFVLRKGPSDVGEIRPAHWFTRKVVAELPIDIPLEIQVFLIWLVIILWRRQERSAAGN